VNRDDILRQDEKDLVGLCREVRCGGVTRRQFVERALLMGLSATAVGALAGACGEGGTAGDAATVRPMDETKPAEIVFNNWVDYMNPDVKKDFQKETGVRVREVHFASNEELFAKLRAGAVGYDVAVPSDYMISIMIKSDMLEPLDMGYLPNFEHVGEQFKYPAFDDPEDHGGLKYSVPYFYGTTGYCQRVDKVPGPESTWEPLFDLSNEGRIILLDDEREILGMGLKKLGYSLNTQDQGELDEATEVLIEQKRLVAAYDSTNMKRNIVQGHHPFVMCWDGDVPQAIDAMGGDEKAEEAVHYVWPEEGFCLWMDGMTVPVGYNSKYGAHLFMDYLMDPKVAGKNASWVWFLSAIAPASWEYTDPFALKLVPTDETLARSEQIDDLGEFASAYLKAWRRIKSA